MILHYFAPDEFHGWHNKMSPELLVKLDVLRHQWKQPIRVSENRRSVGREDNSNSQHNYTKWGEVRAIDVLPTGVVNNISAHRFITLAVDCGFTGIGFYPDWKSGYGFHLDVRTDREIGHPATWGGVINSTGQQVYIPLGEAVSHA